MVVLNTGKKLPEAWPARPAKKTCSFPQPPPRRLMHNDCSSRSIVIQSVLRRGGYPVRCSQPSCNNDPHTRGLPLMTARCSSSVCEHASGVRRQGIGNSNGNSIGGGRIAQMSRRTDEKFLSPCGNLRSNSYQGKTEKKDSSTITEKCRDRFHCAFTGEQVIITPYALSKASGMARELVPGRQGARGGPVPRARKMWHRRPGPFEDDHEQAQGL